MFNSLHLINKKKKKNYVRKYAIIYIIIKYQIHMIGTIITV